ncbi:MAG: hypothetical protein ACI9SG_001667, partial [Maribacter sp.]
NKIRSSFKITLVELDCTNVTNEGSTPEMYGYIDIVSDKDHLAYLSALEAPFDPFKLKFNGDAADAIFKIEPLD